MLGTRITSPSLMGRSFSRGQMAGARDYRRRGVYSPALGAENLEGLGKKAGLRGWGLRATGRSSAFAGFGWDGRRGLCKGEGRASLGCGRRW